MSPSSAAPDPKKGPDPVAAARWFLANGFKAFPVWFPKTSAVCSCPDGPRCGDNIGKHPATPKGKPGDTMGGFHTATDDMAMVAVFLKNPGTRNYGLVCPDDVIAVDVDGAGGLAKWEALQITHGPLPATLTTTTANGRHYFYRTPGGHPSGKMFGFVVRDHDSGYVIGPGSKHASGRYYDTLRQPSGHPFPIADLPEHWIDAWMEARAPKSGAKSTGAAMIEVVEGAPAYEMPESIAEGERYDAIRDFSAHYYNNGLGPEQVFTLLKAELLPRMDVPPTDSDLRSRFDRSWDKIAERLGPPTRSSRTSDPAVEVTAAPTEAVPEPEAMLSTEIKLGALPEEGFPEPLPDTAFDDFAGSLALTLATQTSASREGLLAALLALGGSVLGCHVEYFGRHPGSPFVALVGDSATGRKTTTMQAVHDALSHPDAFGKTDRMEIGSLGSGEGVIATIRRRIDKTPPFWAGALVNAEFGSALTVLQREGSILSMILRGAYDGGTISNITKGSDIEVYGYEYQMGALVGITPDELRALMAKGTSIVDGFANRFCWVPVREREVDLPSGVSYTFDMAQRTILAHALKHALAERHRPMTIDDDAREWLGLYYSTLRGAPAGVGMNRRLHVAALRFAVARAALAGHDNVTLEDVRRSIQLSDYTRAGHGWTFGLMGSKEARRVLQALNALGGESFMSPLGYAAFKSKNAGSKVDDAIEELERLGKVTVVPARSGRRTGSLVRLTDGS